MATSPHSLRLLGNSIALLAVTGLMAYGCERAKSQKAASTDPQTGNPAASGQPVPKVPAEAASKEPPKPDAPGIDPAKSSEPVRGAEEPKAAAKPNEGADRPKPKPIPHDDLAQEAKAPSEFTTPTGVVVQEFKKGEGALTLPKALVTMHFVLHVKEGWKKIQSTYDDGATETYQLNELVEGMADGIIGMQAGAMRRVVVPPSRGFGKAGAKDKDGNVIIPPDAVLVYDIDLISNKQKIVDTAPTKPAPPTFNAGRKSEGEPKE